jgi:hypothetical protein
LGRHTTELGIDVLDGPNRVEAGSLAGFEWIYFRAAWGLMLDVASFDQLGDEEMSPERLWSARDFSVHEPLI